MISLHDSLYHLLPRQMKVKDNVFLVEERDLYLQPRPILVEAIYEKTGLTESLAGHVTTSLTFAERLEMT